MCKQSVVTVQRRTETDDAPVWQADDRLSVGPDVMTRSAQLDAIGVEI